ncbi:PGL/p-HBAD biosynthesis glycosyltransferase [anaerobic digester metagenome]
MKISIITVCFNSAGTILDTMNSVLSQDYAQVEHIVVDGVSTDGTLDILMSFSGEFHLISEKDHGIYDAINKGIRVASGDVIGILNSDDVYADNHVLSRIADEFLSCDVDVVYGDLVYVARNDINKLVRYWKSSHFAPGAFFKGWHPAHPTMFVKKDAYNRNGLYDTTLKSASDYELMLRFFEKNHVRSSYIHSILVKMRCGGKSNKSILNIIISNFECYKSWKMNGFSISIRQFLSRPFSKLKQYFSVQK